MMETKQIGKMEDRRTMKNPEGYVEPVFSNFVNIFKNSREIFIDFGILAPKDSENPKGEEVLLKSRIVLTLEHAKEISEALGRVIKA